MRFRALLAASLALGACAGPPAGARSPALVSPEVLAGRWTLTLDGRAACRLQLTAVPAAHGYRAVPEAGCPAPVAQWRPVPDGVELAGADGLTLILLEPTGAGAFRGFDAGRRAARLARRTQP
jgi:hypothetical protein